MENFLDRLDLSLVISAVLGWASLWVRIARLEERVETLLSRHDEIWASITREHGRRDYDNR